MGTFEKGILGGFSGTVGTVVGGNWKGIDYMRSLSGKRSGGSSPRQLIQQARFALTMRFLQPLTSLLAISFRDYAVKMTGINNAMRYVLENAITGTYPDLVIDYPNVLVSRGTLASASQASAEVSGTSLNFTWTNDAGSRGALATDQALLVAYCPAKHDALWLLNSANRGDGSGSLPLAKFAGQEVQTWLGFFSADGRLIANSVFTGAFTL